MRKFLDEHPLFVHGLQQRGAREQRMPSVSDNPLMRGNTVPTNQKQFWMFPHVSPVPATSNCKRHGF